MTTYAPNQDADPQRDQIEERRRAAWGAYSASLRDLEGRDYDEAERRSWERLQRRLRELEGESADLASSSTSAGPRR